VVPPRSTGAGSGVPVPRSSTATGSTSTVLPRSVTTAGIADEATGRDGGTPTMRAPIAPAAAADTGRARVEAGARVGVKAAARGDARPSDPRATVSRAAAVPVATAGRLPVRHGPDSPPLRRPPIHGRVATVTGPRLVGAATLRRLSHPAGFPTVVSEHLGAREAARSLLPAVRRAARTFSPRRLVPSCRPHPPGGRSAHRRFARYPAPGTPAPTRIAQARARGRPAARAQIRAALAARASQIRGVAPPATATSAAAPTRRRRSSTRSPAARSARSPTRCPRAFSG
jgi:hypothetical protein